MTPQQQRRLGELLAMGIPLPLALAALNEDPKDIQQEVVRVSELLRPTNILDQLGLSAGTQKKKRKTKKQRNYSKAFKKVQSKYKLKSGKWKKDGFKRAVKEAHKLAKKMK